jgi:GTP-binding protein Era
VENRIKNSESANSGDAFRSGFAAIIGKPNAGKSTLMNGLVGEKLAIITPKAQTTRHRITGILNDPAYQIVFSDTPGVIRPKYKLQESMMKYVGTAIQDADVIVLVADVDEQFPEEELLAMIPSKKIPVVLAMNKADTASQEKIERRIQEISAQIQVQKAFAISALKKQGLEALLEGILTYIPEGPPYFDQDMLTDRPERFFVAEIIREQIFLKFEEEIPYGTEVSILEFKDSGDRVHIEAEIHTERRNHKGILIGKNGAGIKSIGTAAREEIQKLLDKPVHLNLYVRVAEKWKNSPRYLKGFGY